MNKLTRDDLYPLEKYVEMRDDFRVKIMAHKINRRLNIGENVVLLFEDKLIMQYQIQEMLKAERIFEAEGIQEELDTYNPLIPDGNNFKATMLIQYADVDERKHMLSKLIGIELKTWVQVSGYEKICAIADEDLERDNEEKTSAVHFLRFELNSEMITALKNGADLSAGIDHENYEKNVQPVPDNIKTSLTNDLQLT